MWILSYKQYECQNALGQYYESFYLNCNRIDNKIFFLIFLIVRVPKYIKFFPFVFVRYSHYYNHHVHAPICVRCLFLIQY